MKRISFMLLVVVFGTSFCAKKESVESPATSFKKLQQAACQSNADEFLSRLDIEGLLVAIYKEDEPKATDADIQAFKSSKDFGTQKSQIEDALRKLLAVSDNNFCKGIMKTVKSEGDTAIIHVQEDPDDPYYIQAYVFTKVGNKWIWSSMDGFVDPPMEATAQEIDKAYSSNALAADQKYKGKAISINSKVRMVDKDIAGRVFIMIGSGIVGDVQCYVRASHVQKAAELKVGDDIRITGIGNGKLLIPDLIECVW